MTCRHLFEGISVGLQADFHHLERVHDNSFRQASAEAGHGERLHRRWKGLKGQSVKIKFVCSSESERTHEATFVFCFFSLKGGK